MCGRYALARSVDDIASAFGVREVDDEPLAPDWNVAPTKTVPVCLVRDGHRVLTSARWGLVPSWADDPSVGSSLVNARMETVAEKPAFRDAFDRRRCLLPADGWYEWQRRPDGSRQPYYLSLASGDLCAFAGLWERWHDAEGRALTTVTIVTGPAPDELASLHDRAPMLLPPALRQRWLDPALGRAVAGSLLAPVPPGIVVSWPVGDDVGDVRATGAQLAAPVQATDQPALF
jgi:putative SOS response-associated peptidase YedK